MSVLALLIIFFFTIFAFASFIELWGRIETNYPKNHHPISNILFKILLILIFSPILITAGWLFIIGIMMRG
jgi:hypothetical protein